MVTGNRMIQFLRRPWSVSEEEEPSDTDYLVCLCLVDRNVAREKHLIHKN